jgi:RecA-family ATPase
MPEVRPVIGGEDERGAFLDTQYEAYEQERMAELGELPTLRTRNGTHRKSALVLPPNVLRAAADVEMLPVEWLWRWRIPRAMLSMFDGDPGLCKSTIMIDLAARLSRGEPLPGDEELDLPKVPKGSILVSFEDTAAHVIKPRLVAAGADCSRVMLWDMDVQPFNVVESLALLAEKIREVGAAWVVIDPLMASFPSNLNAHRDQDVRAVLAPLSKLAETTGCAITFVRHLNKSGGASAIYRGGGSIGIIGAARAGMVLGLDPSDATKGKSGSRILAMTKCNVGKAANALKLRVVSAPSPAPRIEVARIQWEGDVECSADELVAEATDQERGNTTDTEEWLRSLLEGGPQDAAEVKVQARNAGFSWRTVERAKERIGVRAKRRGFGAAGVWQWKLPGYDE